MHSGGQLSDMIFTQCNYTKTVVSVTQLSVPALSEKRGSGAGPGLGSRSGAEGAAAAPAARGRGGGGCRRLCLWLHRGSPPGAGPPPGGCAALGRRWLSRHLHRLRNGAAAAPAQRAAADGRRGRGSDGRGGRVARRRPLLRELHASRQQRRAEQQRAGGREGGEGQLLGIQQLRPRSNRGLARGCGGLGRGLRWRGCRCCAASCWCGRYRRCPADSGWLGSFGLCLCGPRAGRRWHWLRLRRWLGWRRLGL